MIPGQLQGRDMLRSTVDKGSLETSKISQAMASHQMERKVLFLCVWLRDDAVY